MIMIMIATHNSYNDIQTGTVFGASEAVVVYMDA